MGPMWALKMCSIVRVYIQQQHAYIQIDRCKSRSLHQYSESVLCSTLVCATKVYKTTRKDAVKSKKYIFVFTQEGDRGIVVYARVNLSSILCSIDL